MRCSTSVKGASADDTGIFAASGAVGDAGRDGALFSAASSVSATADCSVAPALANVAWEKSAA